MFRLLPAFLCGLALAGTIVSASRAQGIGKTLPRLTDATASEEVSGRIADSTRGRPGPVRLVLRLAGGEELAVLMVPDAQCDRLGLSLKTGEEITVVGYRMSTGTRPLLVARTVVEASRRVDLRGGNRESTTGRGEPPTPLRVPDE